MDGCREGLAVVGDFEGEEVGFSVLSVGVCVGALLVGLGEGALVGM